MILLYHKVHAEAKTPWWVDADTFYRQLAALRTKRVVYLDEYDLSDPDQVVITFDGVYRNVLEYAAPLLGDLGYPFELFLTGDYVGRDNAFDTVEPHAMFASSAELVELVRLGGRLQWHTRSHRNLRDVTDRELIRRELSIPEALRALDPQGFRWFAYAHGDFNDVAVEEARPRFAGALSCDQGNDTDRYRLNRLTVTNDTVFPWPAKVAVIVPSYNYGAFLPEAVESVLRQTRLPDDILIVDDASEDSTEMIGQALAKAHPGVVRFHRNARNLGIVDNFNLAVSLTSSDYVCFLGADNRFRADYVERLAALLDAHPQAAIAYSDFALFGPRAKLVHAQFPAQWRGPIVHDSYHIVRFPDFAEEGLAGLERHNFIHGSSMYRRSVFRQVGGYLPRDGGPEDYHLFLRMARAGWTAVRCAQPLLEYRQHSREQAQGRLESAAEARFFRSEHAALERTVREVREQLGALQKLLTEREESVARALEELRLTHKRLQDTQVELEQSREAARHREEELTRALSRRDQEVAHMLASHSWRMTAPLRWARRRTGVTAVQRTLKHNLLLWRGEQALRESKLFDAEYYLQANPDVRLAGTDPARHYLFQGWKELRDPSPEFSTSTYLAHNPDVARAGVNPLLHYLRHGHREAREAGPSGSLLTGGPQSLAADREQAQAKLHAQLEAEVAAIRASGLFDEAFYRSVYADVPLGVDAIRHYCEAGWREGRDPSEDFDTAFYLATYRDVRDGNMNPFYHYVTAGIGEERYPVPDLDTRYEDDIRFGIEAADVRLIAFHSRPDWNALRAQRQLLKGHALLPAPHDTLGYYDPGDPAVLERQVDMAKQRGLTAFCFALEGDLRPGPSATALGSFIAARSIAFRFCVRVTPESAYNASSLAAAAAIACADPRYLRVGSRPLIVVMSLPGRADPSAFAKSLREAVAARVGEDPFLVVQGVPEDEAGAGDAVLDLPVEPVPGETGGLTPRTRGDVDVIRYGAVASRGVERVESASRSSGKVLPAITLGRAAPGHEGARPLAYARFHVRHYRKWLDAAIAAARATADPDHRLVFLNAWNAWHEGLFLEPDAHSGFSRLNETARALLGLESGKRMPKVSVIVPNYNHAPFLRRRLDSIYGQTYRNIEVLLLDDHSADDSRALLDEYAATHAEITRTIYNESNSGSAFRQWARGIKAATGDLVWIAESDDYCDERFLETLVRCFDDEAVLLGYCKSAFVDRHEQPMRDEFELYLSDLECAGKWAAPYVETAHNEVRIALGIKNTIPNASAVLFKRPLDMPLLDDPSWLAMKVAGDWVFYLHVARGGKIAYTNAVASYFRRYPGSTAERTYRDEAYFREVGIASRTAAALYDVPLDTLERSRRTYRDFYLKMVGRDEDEFWLWYDYAAVLRARDRRPPNAMVCTMGFYPGGAEILPVRLVNELKRRGLSVLLFSTGLNRREENVRRMVRNDVPVVETASIEAMRQVIRDFGIEALNTHQWHIQKYPLQVPDVFDDLRVHVASLHGMIEHGEAFGATAEQLREADRRVTTWVYTAEKNLAPFKEAGLYEAESPRFVKIPNGMQPPKIVPVPRSDMAIPDEAFVLCCVSRAIPDKGWAETMEVVARARGRSGRDIHLVLVGNGPVYEEHCRSGVSPFVHLAGFSDNSVGHYAAADMGIMLTKFKSESFPLTVVDCLFAGKPFIASDVGDIRNMLTTPQGVAGGLVELVDWAIPIDECARLVAAFATDRELYEGAAAHVREAATRFRMDTVAEHYVELFEGSGRRSRDRTGASRVSAA